MNNKFWPNGKKFAFTVIDDTDNSTMENAPIIYDFLKKMESLRQSLFGQEMEILQVNMTLLTAILLKMKSIFNGLIV